MKGSEKTEEAREEEGAEDTQGAACSKACGNVSRRSDPLMALGTVASLGGRFDFVWVDVLSNVLRAAGSDVVLGRVLVDERVDDVRALFSTRS